MKTTVAATQMGCDWNLPKNLDRAESLVRDAAEKGANIVLLQELFATPYFCPDQDAKYFDLAEPAESGALIARFSNLAKELGVVLPISFYERANNAYFNSIAIPDANGDVLGVYRKSHIPQGPGYEEKFFFSPGDTGFKVWETAFGTIGVAICWDQWFPECARAMAVMGAEILFYPTAIGCEPHKPEINSKDHWQRAMQGHAAANMVGLVASNRIGSEENKSCTMTFYGHSFIANGTGEMVAELDDKTESVALASFDLDAMRTSRSGWGLFRDRRPDLYGALATLDGRG